MKAVLLALCAILTVTTARVVISVENQDVPYLLGAKACTWGPTYWCQNITTASGCNTTQHCIAKVWEGMTVPEDNDTVCGICKDMVQQARDQLESNETQQDLKTVFEGSCALMRIKPIVMECDNLVDQFIPELVETLASQMNPSVVCSVAGLCNSVHIDEMLLEYQKSMTKNDGLMPVSLANDELEPDECSKCYTIATHMVHKISETPRDALLERMLILCGRMSSFSDACSSIVLTYFNSIYSHLQENLNAGNICHLSGQCSGRFHKHENDTDKAPEVEIRPLSSVGMVEVSDELPCKLCKQLVIHLKDLLVANTTVIEFEHVLLGLCKQTKSFAAECKAIVSEYYEEIYSYLTNELDSNTLCQVAEICLSSDKTAFNGPIWPLIPEAPTKIGMEIMNEAKEKLIKNEAKVTHERTEAEEMQLPIERMHLPIFESVPFPTGLAGSQSCALCEYLLHYIQQAITNPITEEKVKHVIEKVCQKLPKSEQNNCQEFVNTYGDAVVAILAQQIDPSQVCPMLHICPSEAFMDAWEQVPKDMMIQSEVKEKPNCPLCLFAVTQLYSVIKNNKTEESIKAALDKLCIHLPKDLKNECEDLVQGYSKELVDLLIADLTPQEVCVFLKLCNASTNPGSMNSFPTDKDGEILTNEIPNFPLHPIKQKSEGDDIECVICEFVMQYIEKEMNDVKTKDEIEKLVHGVCNHLPKTIGKDCNDFVSEYADFVIDLLSQQISPKEICGIMGLCKVNIDQIRESVAECALCEAVASTIDKSLTDSNVNHDVEEVVSKICKQIAANKQRKCTMMMEIYEPSIINVLKSTGSAKRICSKLALCAPRDYYAMSARSSRTRRSEPLGLKRCTWGPTYWCSSDDTAAECKAVDHCKEKVWKAESAAAAKQTAVSQT